MSLALGLVTKVHPADRSVDVVLVRDGARLAGVQVLGEMVSDRAGSHDLHEVGASADGDDWSVVAARARQNTIAVIGYIGRLPVVLGFLPPQVSQLLFDRADFRINRHPSDVYTTTDADGNVEVYHPSGTYLRIAEDPEHEDLTGEDFDAKFKIDRNTARAPWLSVMVKSAGVQKASLRIDPSGNVSLDHVGDFTSHTGGAASVTVDGDAAVHVGGTTAVTSAGDMSITAPNLAITANIATVGALTNNGKNVGSTHTHGGVASGLSHTAVPD